MRKKQIILLRHPFTQLTRLSATTNPQLMVMNLSKGAGAELEIYYSTPRITNYHNIEQKILEHYKDSLKLSKWINKPAEEIKQYIETLTGEFIEVDIPITIEPTTVKDFNIIEGLPTDFYGGGELNLEQTEENFIYYNKDTTNYYLILKTVGITKTFECINLFVARKVKSHLGGLLK